MKDQLKLGRFVTVRPVVVGFGICTLLVLVWGGVTAAQSFSGYRPCPLLALADQGVQAEIVGRTFLSELEASNGTHSIPAEMRDRMRSVLLTVRIRKPAGQRITLAAADLTLHYYHGDASEVAACWGLSTFGTDAATDRLVTLGGRQGPGFLKQTTGARTTAASEVYIDVLFTGMEPDSDNAWLCIGNPIHGAAYSLGGYDSASSR